MLRHQSIPGAVVASRCPRDPAHSTTMATSYLDKNFFSIRTFLGNMKKINQSLFFRLRETLHTLSPAEKRVGMALIADFPITGLKTVAEIAEASGTSPATV